MNGARLLLEGLFDYAGLFPPAELPLDEVIRNFADYRRGTSAWMLGRLVVPITRLAEVEALVAPLPDDAFAQPWGLAVLGSGGPEDDRQALAEAVIRHHTQGRRLSVESIELKVSTPLEVRRARTLSADGWTVYCEPTRPSDAVLDAVAIAGLRAKIRMGGATPDRIPPASDVARMLAGCVQRGISLKATAGLHHAVTGTYPLTYAAHGPTATLHGYVNLLVAAGVAEAAGVAAVRADEVVAALARILALETRPAFTVGGVLEWMGHDGPITEGPLHGIAATARALVRGIGTCSFEEPAAEACSLGLR